MRLETQYNFPLLCLYKRKWNKVINVREEKLDLILVFSCMMWHIFGLSSPIMVIAVVLCIVYFEVSPSLKHAFLKQVYNRNLYKFNDTKRNIICSVFTCFTKRYYVIIS